MRVLKTTQKKIKVINICFLIFSFITTPGLQAQQQAPTQAAAQMGGLVNTLTQAFTSMTGQSQTLQMPQLTTVPAKYFNQCQIIPDETNFPKNACEQDLNPADIAGANNNKQLATFASRNVITISKMNNQASSNPNTTVGLACLDNQLKNLGSMYTRKINELEAYKDAIKVNNERFIESNKALLAKMADQGHLLYGSNFNGLANEAHLSLKKAFGDENDNEDSICINLVGDDNFLKAKPVGLQGLTDSIMAPRNQMASNFTKNKNLYQKEIEDQIAEVQKKIKTKGAEAWDGNYTTPAGQIEYPSIQNTIAKSQQELRDDIATIRSDLEGIYVLPPVDHNFAKEIAKFSANAPNILRKNNINQCVTGQGAAAHDLTQDNIINNLQFTTTNGKGSGIENYTKALLDILQADGFIEDKLSLIEKLDKSFSNKITVPVKSNIVQTSGNLTPSSLFRGIVRHCEGLYNKSGSAGQLSMQERTEEAAKKIREVEAKQAKFSTDLGNDIFEEVVNCSKAPLKAGSCTLNTSEQLISPDGAQFCIAHADTCSQTITSCNQKVKGLVASKKDQMVIMQKQYDQNMLALVAAQKAEFAKVKDHVATLANGINQVVSDATPQYPEEGFAVKTPEPQLITDLGVHLRGGGELDSMEQLGEKIDLLKMMLEDQKNQATNTISEYIALQQNNIAEEQSKWEELAQKCGSSIEKRDKVAAQANQQQDKAIGEANGFCDSYNAPQPTCGRVSQLAGNSSSAVASLNGAALNNARLVEGQFCDNQDEVVADELPSKEDQFRNLASLCEEHNDDFDEVKKELINNFSRTIPTSHSFSRSDILKYLKTGEGFDELDKNDDFIKTRVKELRSAIDSAEKDADISHYGEADEKTVAAYKKMTQIKKFDGVSNYCQSLKLSAAQIAIEENTNGSEIKISSAKRDYNKNLDGTGDIDGGHASIARRIASADLPFRATSHSGEIGQQLRQVPCGATSGAGNTNNARSNAFTALDEAILGAGNTQGLNFDQ